MFELGSMLVHFVPNSPSASGVWYFFLLSDPPISENRCLLDTVWAHNNDEGDYHASDQHSDCQR